MTMNLIALSDHKLSLLRQKVAQELERRCTMTTSGLDAAAIVSGNELAKRALIVAAAGSHSILFLGPSNCGKSMLRAAALELGLTASFEARLCPCGNRSDPGSACHCTIGQILRYLRKIPTTDITVEMRRPSHREMGCPGTTLADMRKQIEAKAPYAPTDLSPLEASLMRATTVELNLDPAAQRTILAVARTVASLDQCQWIGSSHLMEAVNYRSIQRG